MFFSVHALLAAGLDPFWILVLIALLLLGVVAVGLSALGRIVRLELRLAQRLEPLARIESLTSRLVESHSDLDLRRVEHALIDVRDGLRRQEERLGAMLDALEEARQSAPTGLAAGLATGLTGSSSDAGLVPRNRAAALRERVVSRLLALGFDRVEVLTPFDELDALLESDGEILVVARRGGAQHKGRATVRDGSLADVHMRAAYEAFP